MSLEIKLLDLGDIELDSAEIARIFSELGTRWRRTQSDANCSPQ
jgi:hypothetical protein